MVLKKIKDTNDVDAENDKLKLQWHYISIQ